jgi:hypothetical protein
MPVHDWSRIDPETFHAFHTAWITHLSEALNGGLLPADYYALPEQPATRGTQRTLVVRHVSGHRIIALGEIVSPANKDRATHVEEFVDKVETALLHGIHVLLGDLFPPGLHDPRGMHGAVWERFDDEPYEAPAGEPLCFASYVAGPRPVAYLEHLAVGAPLPQMPLFLNPDRYIYIPLEATYQAAFRGLPAFWRDVLEGRQPPPR